MHYFSIFYGDEIGVQGIGNLANRTSYPWNHRDKDLLKFFRTLGKIRKQEKFLKDAETKILKINNEQFIFERYDKNSKILVIASRTHLITRVNLPEEYKNSKILFKVKGCNEMLLSPFGAIVIKK